jgi:hypothetical protein
MAHAVHPVFGAELAGQAIARSSATQHISLEWRKSRGSPRISQMPWSFFPPPAGSGVGGGGEELPGDRVEFAELVDQPLSGAEQLAVDVELPLPPRAVADPDRAAVPPPGQVRQFPFGQVPLATDAEHDLQVRPVLQLGGGGVGKEGEELASLVRAGCHPQSPHGEAGIADPGVAVVPVALAADGLRQRRGQQQPVSAAPGGQPSWDRNQERVDESVLRPGGGAARREIPRPERGRGRRGRARARRSAPRHHPRC